MRTSPRHERIRFPEDNIQRIEVIRGPGSAIYGGNAELAVINIIAEDARDAEFSVGGTHGRLKNGVGRESARIRFARRVSEETEATAYAEAGRAQRSAGTYEDLSEAP